MPTNNFLTFCPDDTGTNLPDQADYAVAADRESGNKPGIASSSLNNKALRQANYGVSSLAQFMADQTGADVLDIDDGEARFLAQLNAAVVALPPVITKYTSGSGNFNLQYIFFIASGSATAGATYTNNAVTFTVVATVASGVQIKMTGNGDPAVSGTLTKSGGTGDTTLTFYAFRKPVALRVRLSGGGGGGAGSGTASGSAAGTGGTTTFGTTLLSGSGGGGGSRSTTPGTGGAASLGTGPLGLAIAGGAGGGNFGTSTDNLASGGQGGSNTLGGAGAPGVGGAQAGTDGATNSGAGGGGGGMSATASGISGGGGGAGGYVDANIASPLSAYAYAVGAAGTAGGAGTSGAAGGAGAAGVILVEERYQ